MFPGERVDINIVDSKEEAKRKGIHFGPRYVAMLPDRNTRKLYSQKMTTKSGPEVERTYKALFERVEADT